VKALDKILERIYCGECGAVCDGVIENEKCYYGLKKLKVDIIDYFKSLIPDYEPLPRPCSIRKFNRIQGRNELIKEIKLKLEGK